MENQLDNKVDKFEFFEKLGLKCNKTEIEQAFNQINTMHKYLSNMVMLIVEFIRASVDAAKSNGDN